jgi:hypothetical protein
MERPRTFYILGAGTSFGLAPTTSEARRLIRDRYSAIGIYPATAQPVSALHPRIATHDNSMKYGLPDLLLENSPSSTLELLAQKEWSPALDPVAPPQYAVLRKVGAPGIFFSFNLDGLAAFYLRNLHVVFEPHGTVDRSLTQDSGFAQRLEWSLDISLPSLRPKVLPGPEPRFITSRRAYLDARPYVQTAPAIIILGYSFGTFRGRMDDTESFEYLIDNQSKARCPIFIVSPDPEPIVASLQDRLRDKRVIPMSLYWHHFSTVLDTLMGPMDRFSDWLPDQNLDYLLASYELCCRRHRSCPWR